jgi:hypothetical protein
MTISYNGLRQNKNLTMPSVVSWGTNNNILKDPPRAITTRKKDKVGENMDIVNMQDESGDRITNFVQVYSRSLNPSVSVSYSNHGSNGGQKAGGNYLSGRTPSLPYKIGVDGDVRVPGLQAAQSTLAVSTMSRTKEVLTNPVISHNEAGIYNNIADNYEDCVEDNTNYDVLEKNKMQLNLELDTVSAEIAKLRSQGQNEGQLIRLVKRQEELENNLSSVNRNLQMVYSDCKNQKLQKHCQSTKIDYSQLSRGTTNKIKVDGLVKSNISNKKYNPGAQEVRSEPVGKQIHNVFRPDHEISSGLKHHTVEGQNTMENFHVSSSIGDVYLNPDVNINKGARSYLKEGFIQVDTDIYVNPHGELVKDAETAKTNDKVDRMFLLDGDTSGNRTREQSLHFQNFQTSKASGHVGGDYIHGDICLQQSRPNFENQITNKGAGHVGGDYIHDDIHLRNNRPNFENQMTSKAAGHVGGDYIHDDLTLESNRPYFENQMTGKAVSYVGGDYIHSDITLENNRPNIENHNTGKSVTYIGGDYIHDDIILEQKAPQVENKFASKSGEYTKNLRHNNELQFSNNIPNVNVKTALSDMTGGETEKSSRDFYLPDQLVNEKFDVPVNLQKDVLDKPTKIAGNFLDKNRANIRQSANNARNER